jgi:magnesium-transporting ATPase (P-type)
MVLEEGIEGRRTFANMLKYIKMTASSNFGNVFSVLVASAFLPFLPMLPLHLLIQNLLYDVSQVAIPFDNVDDEQIQNRSAGTLGTGALYGLLWPDQLDFRYSDLLPDVVGVPCQRAGSPDAVPVGLVY